MNIVQLSYFELLSSEPVYLKNIGGIISPTLKDISSIGINTYQYFLSILLMDKKTFFDSYVIQNVLNFFIKENVSYSNEHECFLIHETETTGIITKEIYPKVCDLILQRNYIKTQHNEDLSKIENPKALEIMKKIQKGRAESKKNTQTDENMELGNIISAVANKGNGLNILNIWDITIFQLWDCFMRLSNNNIYDIQSMSVAAWGNKDKYFDFTSWYKRIYN